MDCSRPLGNDGCDGGYIDTSFQYVRENPGLDGEVSYTFESADAECRYKPEAKEAECTGSLITKNFAIMPNKTNSVLDVSVS